MRLWSLHPKYLDARGLVAVWREALLAQKVLQGQTQGYRRHPQLERFKQRPAPAAVIAAYLQGVYREAARRGYQFDQSKIASWARVRSITVTQGQLDYEWQHLKRKLRVRAPARYRALLKVRQPEPHPLFRVVAGEVESWEKLPVKRGVY
jgi:hypothetical protein